MKGHTHPVTREFVYWHPIRKEHGGMPRPPPLIDGHQIVNIEE